MRYTSFFLCSFIFCGLLKAQQPIYIDSATVGYSIKNYTVADGLSQNTVKDIEMDTQGFLWMTTEKGLSRFDGISFKNFTGLPYSSRAKRLNAIHWKGDSMLFPPRLNFTLVNGSMIYEESRDFSDGYYICYGGLTLERAKHPELANIDLWSIGEMNNFHYKNDSSFYLRSSNLSSEKFVNRDNLHFFENGQLKGEIPNSHLPNPPEPNVFQFNDWLCVLENKKVLKVYDGVKAIDSVRIDFLGDINIAWSALQTNTFIYSQLQSSLYQVVLRDGRISLKLLVSNFEVQTLLNVLELNSGKELWIGSGTSGLYHLRKYQFTTLYSMENKAANNMRSVFEIGKDTIASDGGLILSSGGSEFVDHDVEAWKKLLPKISKFHPRDKKINYNFRKGALLQDFFGFGGLPCVMDNNNRIWQVRGGSLFYEEEGDSSRKVEVGGWNGGSFQEDLFYDPYKDEIWLTAFEEEKQMYAIRVNDDEFHIKKLEGCSLKGEVPEISFSSDGMAWIRIVEDGFYMYRVGKLIQLPMDPMGYLKHAHCIIEDQSGFFWISSDFGLFKVLKQDLLDYFADPEKQVYYFYYDKSWGFRNNEFNGMGHPCGTIMSDGKLAFPSFEGAVLFDPNTVGEDKHGSRMIIDQIKLDGKDTVLGSKWVMDQNYQELELKVAHTFYGHPNNIYLQYKLEGYHDDWQNVPEDLRIRFQRLKYGNYKLVVRKLAGHGRDNFVILSVPWTITKWYYQTWWFILSIIGLISLVIVGAFIYRAKRAVQKQKELELIIEEKTEDYRVLNNELKLNLSRLRESEREQHEIMKYKDKMMAIYTHDIRGPLRFISTVAQNTIKALERMKSTDIVRYFNIMDETSQKVFRLTERMFDISNLDDEDLKIKTEKVAIYNSVERCIGNFSAEAGEKNIKLINKVREDFTMMVDVNVLDIILDNLVQNSIKYTDKGSISFESAKLTEFSVLSIIDSGVGIKLDQLNALNSGEYQSTPGTRNEYGKGFGLKMVKGFLKKMDGFMEIDSEPGMGTTIRMFFKET